MGDFSARSAPTFIDGLLMILSAIPDASLVVDGSDCVYEQMDRAMSKHDWYGSIKSGDGTTRLVSSGIEHVTALLGTEANISGRVMEVIEKDAPGAIMLAQLPLMKLMGNDINSIVKQLQKTTETPFIKLDPRMMDRDFLDGFDQAYKSFAENTPESKDIKKGKVSFIGYPFSRNEGEDSANIAFLKQATEALGLELGSIWFSGMPVKELWKISSSEFIFAFPHARQAIEILRGKSKSQIIETPLPVGLSGTRNFIELLGKTANREEKAQQYVDRHLYKAVPRLEWVIHRVFAGKRVVLISDPLYLPALRDYLSELGMNVCLEISRSRRKAKDFPGSGDKDDLARLFDPSLDMLSAHITNLQKDGDIDLVIGNSWERDSLHEFGLPFFEFGFPSIMRHSIADEPTWGFNGALTLANQWCNIVMESEYSRSRQRQ